MNTNTQPETKPTQEEVTARLVAMTAAEVSSVYSGKPGCCCGCKGNHRYNSQHVVSASKNRGYAVTGSDINDRQVAKVLDVIQANVEKAAENYLADFSYGYNNYFWVEITHGGFD